MKNPIALFIVTGWIVGAVNAQDDNALTRDEVTVVKKKLTAIFDALGDPPAGYAKTEETFSLPTEISKGEAAGKYHPVYGSASRRYGSASEKKAKQSSQELQAEYEKKIMEAQAKGDYQLMGQLVQEVQQKAGQAQLEGVEGRKEPIDVQVSLNANPYQTIDPDAVVFESPGIMALKFAQDVDGTKGRVVVYADPVNLKDTKKLSVVNMKEPEGGVTKRTAATSATVEFSGPMADIEAWAKKVNTKKILAQIE